MEECANVLEILKEYEEALGKKINRSKTSLFFSKSTSEELKHGIKAALGVLEILHYEKYLGLPSLVGKEKKKVLTTSRKRFGGNFKGGKQNYFHKPEGKCS